MESEGETQAAKIPLDFTFLHKIVHAAVDSSGAMDHERGMASEANPARHAGKMANAHAARWQYEFPRP